MVLNGEKVAREKGYLRVTSLKDEGKQGKQQGQAARVHMAKLGSNDEEDHPFSSRGRKHVKEYMVPK